MRFSLLTESGQSYNQEVEYIVLRNQDGELAILKDHVPIIIPIHQGHVKLVNGNQLSFGVVEAGILEFKDNRASILALEGLMGETLEEVRIAFQKLKKDKLEMTKRENIDFSKQERELKENIQKSKAGQL